MDVVLNFASPALTDDNLITRLAALGKRIVFYGDDTWLRLFPDTFIRSEGTVSFFVADTVEVDTNVTRHVPRELARDDWDVLILHYLGLDHIGHTGGPHSPLMPEKQAEMDRVIATIHEALIADQSAAGGRTLLVVCGDHGMTEDGAHGGASPGEVSAALLFADGRPARAGAAPCPATTVRQEDVAATLALMTGADVPHGSMGVLIEDAFPNSTAHERLLRLHQNAAAVAAVLEAYADDAAQRLLDGFAHAVRAHREWMPGGDVAAVSAIEDEYRKFLTIAASECVLRSTRVDSYGVAAGLAMLAFAAVHGVVWWALLVAGVPAHSCAADLRAVWRARRATALVCGALAAVTLAAGLRGLLLVASLCYCAAIVRHGALAWRRVWACMRSGSALACLLFLGTAVQTLSLASSSFVEEEHYMWHHLVTSAHVLLLADALRTRHLAKLAQCCALLVLGRLIRGWNQSGVKWRGLPDIATFLDQHPRLLEIALIVALTSVVIPSWRDAKGSVRALSSVCLSAAAAATLLHHLPLGGLTGVWVARAVYVFLALFLLLRFVSGRPTGSLGVAGALLMMLLHRGSNVPLLAVVVAWFALLARSTPDWLQGGLAQQMLKWWMGRMCFFALGNSNCIATVEFRGAYAGLSGYSAGPVAVLTFVVVFSGPLLAALLAPPARGDVALVTSAAQIAGTTFTAFFSAVILWHMRFHLFVWSVFAPKYLYVVAFCLFETLMSVATNFTL